VPFRALELLKRQLDGELAGMVDLLRMVVLHVGDVPDAGAREGFDECELRLRLFPGGWVGLPDVTRVGTERIP
jgi:hypothetical protein